MLQGKLEPCGCNMNAVVVLVGVVLQTFMLCLIRWSTMWAMETSAASTHSTRQQTSTIVMVSTHEPQRAQQHMRWDACARPSPCQPSSGPVLAATHSALPMHPQVTKPPATVWLLWTLQSFFWQLLSHVDTFAHNMNKQTFALLRPAHVHLYVSEIPSAGGRCCCCCCRL
jgi:hypothetical protein